MIYIFYIFFKEIYRGWDLHGCKYLRFELFPNTHNNNKSTNTHNNNNNNNKSTNTHNNNKSTNTHNNNNYYYYYISFQKIFIIKLF